MQFLSKVQAESESFVHVTPYNVNLPHGEFVAKIGDRVKIMDGRRNVSAYFKVTKINENGFEVEVEKNDKGK